MPASLPAGLTVRPATRADLGDIAALFAIAETHDLGEAVLTREDIEAGWNRKGFDLTTDTRLVFDRRVLAASAEVCEGRADVVVHPRWRGRGVGTHLLGWVEQRARSQPSSMAVGTIGQTVPDSNRSAAALFRADGYEIGHTSWILALPAHREVVVPSLPAGMEIRGFRPDTDERAVYQVVEDAFNEWPGRQPQTFEQWRTWITARPGFNPALLKVAVNHDAVIGMVFGIEYPDEGWVQQLAVRADHRGRGLGKALLATMFGEFRAMGYTRIGLNTDSRTGTLGLYLGLGMEVAMTFTRFTKAL